MRNRTNLVKILSQNRHFTHFHALIVDRRIELGFSLLMFALKLEIGQF